MNRFILKYGYAITTVVMVVFGWVVYRRVSGGWSEIIPLAVTAVLVWVIGAPTFIYLWPRITVVGYKRAIVGRGLGAGPIPVNTLYAEPGMSSAAASKGGLMATGTDDVIYVVGWLDLRDGPQVLHVPEMDGRYYSVQFTDPTSGANYAYVGKRTTGTHTGDHVIATPVWHGTIPGGMTRVTSPSRSVLIIGRVFVENESDQPSAYALARQIQVTPLSR